MLNLTKHSSPSSLSTLDEGRVDSSTSRGKAAKPSAQAACEPRELHNRAWSALPGISFVPEHFMVLPSRLPYLAPPPVKEAGWQDPLGAGTARANATVMTLGGGRFDPAWSPAATDRHHQTAWSKAMLHGSVLQLQPPAPGSPRGLAGFGCALVAANVSDLIMVASPRKDVTDGREQLGFDNKNIASLALLDGGHYRGDDGAALQSLIVETTPPRPPVPPSARKGWGNKLKDFSTVLPRGDMSISTTGGASRVQTHDLKTHWLDIRDPGWVRALMCTVMESWHDGGKNPLNLAVMCHDGASESGMAALALHGMHCMESHNRGQVVLNGPADLADQLRDFAEAGRERRSSSFANCDQQRPDFKALAEEITVQWLSMHTSPDTPVVVDPSFAHLKPHPVGRRPSTLQVVARTPTSGTFGTAATGDIHRRLVSDDSGFLSPTETNADAHAVVLPEGDEGPTGSTEQRCAELLDRSGVSRAIQRLVGALIADTALQKTGIRPGWFAHLATKFMDAPASKLNVLEIMNGNIGLPEGMPELIDQLAVGVRPLLAQVLANGGDRRQSGLAGLAARLREDETERQVLNDQLDEIVMNLLDTPPTDTRSQGALGHQLRRQALASALLKVIEEGAPTSLPAPMLTSAPPRFAKLKPAKSLGSIPFSTQVNPWPMPELAPGRRAASTASGLDLRSRSVGEGSMTSLNSLAKRSRTQAAMDHLKANEQVGARGTNSPGAIWEDISPELQQDWLPGGESFGAFLPKLDGLVAEMTAATGVRGFLKSKLSAAGGRALEPHLSWGAEVAKQVRANLRAGAGHSRDAAPEEAEAFSQKSAAVSHSAVRALLRERFEALDANGKSNWRQRVSGKSERFARAVAQSAELISDLPARLNPSGSLLSLNDRAISKRPALFLEHKTLDQTRHEVDKIWGPQWVLSLMREVAMEANTRL